MKIKDLDESWGMKRGYYNPLDQERREQRQMDWEKRDFKRRELEHELAGEEEAYRREMSATYYIRINGKLLVDKQGIPYSFRGKEAAKKAAYKMMEKPFNKGKQFSVTNSPTDFVAKEAINEDPTPGAVNTANMGSIPNPHHSPGPARGKKSYLGTPGGPGGSKAPPQPKVVQPKNPDGTAKNGVDMPNLFGAGAVKRR